MTVTVTGDRDRDMYRVLAGRTCWSCSFIDDWCTLLTVPVFAVNHAFIVVYSPSLPYTLLRH